MSHLTDCRYVYGGQILRFSNFKFLRTVTGQFALQNGIEFFTGTNPQREPAIFWHVRFEWSWSNSGLGCGQVNAAGKQVGKAERFDFLQQDDDMHVVLQYTQYMIRVFVCVKCSIYISFDIYILACLLKIYSGVNNHIHFRSV